LKYFKEEHAKAKVRPPGAETNDTYKPSWEFYEQLQFVNVVPDDTYETSGYLTSEPKHKLRKLSKQQQQNAREERKLDLFSEAVRASQEPVPQVVRSQKFVLKDEVAAYCNYIRPTLPKFSAHKSGELRSEDSGKVDTSNTPPKAYSRDRYSPTPSSSYGSVASYQIHQYPQVEPAAQSRQ